MPSIALGSRSLYQNIKAGNVGRAIVDGVGIVADIGAAALPLVPGGVGLGIQATRATVGVATKVDTAVAVVDGATATVDAVQSGEGLKAVGSAVFVAMGAKASLPGGKTAKATQEESKALTTKKSGGESPAAADGRRAHDNYKTALGEAYETRRTTLPSGKRPDAINWDTREVRELKPDNASAVKRGEKQVEGYRQELERTTGEKWTAVVDTYQTKTKEK